eukprot:6456329-Prymnesium_polylepis.1
MARVARSAPKAWAPLPLSARAPMRRPLARMLLVRALVRMLLARSARGRCRTRGPLKPRVTQAERSRCGEPFVLVTLRLQGRLDRSRRLQGQQDTRLLALRSGRVAGASIGRGTIVEELGHATILGNKPQHGVALMREAQAEATAREGAQEGRGPDGFHG